jgi:outer membrane protein assembly factor BamB
MYSARKPTHLILLAVLIFLGVRVTANPPSLMGISPSPHRLADTAWPMHKQNPQRTGRSPHLGITQPPAVLWQSDLYTNYSSGITIGISNTVHASFRGYTFDLWTGEVIHDKLPLGSMCGSTPAHSQNGNFYLSREFGFMGVTYAGDIIIDLPYAGGCNADNGVIDEDGILYTKTNSYGVLAIDLNTLTVLWQDLVDGFNQTASPALGLNNLVYYNGQGGRLVARHRDGTFAWQSTDSYLHGHPVIGADGTVYAYSHFNNVVSAFEPLTGNVKWHYPITEQSICGQGPQMALGPDGTLYFNMCDDGWEPGNLYLVALNPNGALKWKRLVFASKDPWVFLARGAPITDAAGNIYFCVDNGRCYAYDSDGNKLWDVLVSELTDAGFLLITSPTIAAEGLLLLPSTSGIMAIVTAEYHVQLEPAASAHLVYSSPDGFDVSLNASAGAVITPTRLVLSPMTRARWLPQDAVYVGLPLHLLAYQAQSHIGDLSFAQPMHVTVNYDETALFVDENSLMLWQRSGSKWEPAELSCAPEQRYRSLNTASNTLTVSVCRPGEFALFSNYRAYLPLITK